MLDEKPGFKPQARHQNEIQKVFLRQFHLSRFLAKTLRINKIAMKTKQRGFPQKGKEVKFANSEKFAEQMYAIFLLFYCRC